MNADKNEELNRQGAKTPRKTGKTIEPQINSSQYLSPPRLTGLRKQGVRSSLPCFSPGFEAKQMPHLWGRFLVSAQHDTSRSEC